MTADSLFMNPQKKRSKPLYDSCLRKHSGYLKEKGIAVTEGNLIS